MNSTALIKSSVWIYIHTRHRGRIQTFSTLQIGLYIAFLKLTLRPKMQDTFQSKIEMRLDARPLLAEVGRQDS